MILQDAKECYNQLASFRRKRNRCCDYTFGRQWNDRIEVNGHTMSEYEYILSEGNVPLKNNLIRRIVRNVLGLFRERLSEIMAKEYGESEEGGEMRRIAEENDLEEIFCRTMEEFLISGMAVHRKRLCSLPEGCGVTTEIVSPASFFFNTDSRDVRGKDIRIIGQVHKVDFADWCRAFVKDSKGYEKAMKLFEGDRKITVTELWRKEPIPQIILHDRNKGILRKLSEEESKMKKYHGMKRQWRLEEIWKYYFLAEDGSVLKSGDSPYMDGGHPYVMKCYPFLDGEIQSFVGDMIDQQRYTNRLITLYDWVIRASAKGVLLLPESAVDPSEYQNVANQWGRFNGVIVYKPKVGVPEPKQVSGNMSNLGISELLEIQLKMMEDVSGVNGILQGNVAGGNVSGTLYNSQTTNALYSLSDLLETFRTFIRDCSAKDRLLLNQKNYKFNKQTLKN